MSQVLFTGTCSFKGYQESNNNLTNKHTEIIPVITSHACHRLPAARHQAPHLLSVTCHHICCLYPRTSYHLHIMSHLPSHLCSPTCGSPSPRCCVRWWRGVCRPPWCDRTKLPGCRVERCVHRYPVAAVGCAGSRKKQKHESCCLCSSVTSWQAGPVWLIGNSRTFEMEVGNSYPPLLW